MTSIYLQMKISKGPYKSIEDSYEWSQLDDHIKSSIENPKSSTKEDLKKSSTDNP